MALHPVEDYALIQLALRSASVEDFAREIVRRIVEFADAAKNCKEEARQSDDLQVVARAADIAHAAATHAQNMAGAVVHMLDAEHPLVKQATDAARQGQTHAQLAMMRFAHVRKLRGPADA